MNQTTSTPEPASRRKMSAEEFIKIWKGEYEGVEGYEEFYRRGKFYFNEFIEDVNSKLHVFVNDIEIAEDIIIENEEFHFPNITLLRTNTKNVSIINSTVGDFNVGANSNVGLLKVSSNTCTGNLSIHSYSKSSYFFISDNSKTGYISISNYSSSSSIYVVENSSTGDILVGNNSEVGYVDIRENSSIGDFIVRENSTIAGIKIVENSKAGWFSVSENSKAGELIFWNKAITGNLSVSENSKIGQCKISDNSVVGYMSISENSETGNILIDNSKIPSIEIKTSKIGNIEILNDSFLSILHGKSTLNSDSQVFIRNSTIGKLDLDESIIPESTTLSISESRINEVSLINCCNYGVIFFSNIQSLTEWKDFTKEEHEDEPLIFDKETYQYQFSKNIKPSTLRLADSELGNLQIINCNLHSFDHFEFRNAKMLNVFVAGSQMPSAKAFRLPGEEQPPELVAEQKRLAFGQFKKIYENQGDRSSSLHYLAQEMDAYWDQLWMDIKKPEIKNRYWWGKISDLFILSLNKISTNHGNNWFKGAFFTIVISVLCFVVYLSMLGYKVSDWSKFWDILSYTPQYLNPFRDEDSAQFIERIADEKIQITAGARIWDYFSRVMVAYFVYQTIQAFRKLGRSSG